MQPCGVGVGDVASLGRLQRDAHAGRVGRRADVDAQGAAVLPDPIVIGAADFDGARLGSGGQTERQFDDAFPMRYRNAVGNARLAYDDHVGTSPQRGGDGLRVLFLALGLRQRLRLRDGGGGGGGLGFGLVGGHCRSPVGFW